MLRSAASPGSVGFGRPGGGVSGLLMTPLPAGHIPWPSRWLGLVGRTPGRTRETYLLDLGFAELDVLLGNRVVFLLDHLVGHRPRVLLGDIVEAGIGARHQLDLERDGLGHGKAPEFS